MKKLRINYEDPSVHTDEESELSTACGNLRLKCCTSRSNQRLLTTRICIKYVALKKGYDMLYDRDRDEYYCLRCSFTGNEQEVLRVNAQFREKYRDREKRITEF
jgi:hypothetical protein